MYLILLPNIVNNCFARFTDGGKCSRPLFVLKGKPGKPGKPGKQKAQPINYIEFADLLAQIAVLLVHPDFEELVQFVERVRARLDCPDTTYTSAAWQAMMESWPVVNFAGRVHDLALYVFFVFFFVFFYF